MRALKALVIGMGVLIVVGTVVVAVKMFQLASGLDGSAGSGSGAAAGDGFGTLGLGMAASCEVADAVATEGGLVLRYAGPAKDGCDVLHVVEPDGGRLVGTIAPHAAAPRADAPQGEAEGEPR